MSYNKKNRFNWKMVLVACSLVLILSTTGIASEFFGTIKKAVLPSGSVVLQNKANPNEVYTIPSDMEIYDESGNRVYELTRKELEEKPYFTKDGISLESFTKSKILIEESNEIHYSNFDEVISRLTFMPYELSGNYVLTDINTYSNNSEEKLSALAFNYETSTGTIFVQQRENIPENQGSSSATGDLEEFEIDGVKLIIQNKSSKNGKNMSFETDDVVFFLSYTGDDINNDDMIQIFRDFELYEAK